MGSLRSATNGMLRKQGLTSQLEIALAQKYYDLSVVSHLHSTGGGL
jgi:hypothetical protein